MEGDARRNSTAALPAIIGLLILGVGGVVVSSRPLASPRPPASGMLWHEEPEARDRAKTPARLWQDPVEAVYRAVERDKPEETRAAIEGTPGPGSLVAEVAKAVGRVLVMPVLVSGDRSPDAEDTRIGQRYALLSALGESGFVPEERENIAYYRASADGKELLVPYEWLSVGPGSDPVYPCEESPYGKVLVLWIRQDKIGSGTVLRTLGPLVASSLEPLQKWFRPTLGGGIQPVRRPRVPAMCDVVVLTGGSNQLVDILVEDSKQGDTVKPYWCGERFLAWSATVSDTELKDALDKRLDGGGFAVGRWYPLNCGATLERTIGTDEALFMLLMKELCLRGVDATDGRNHIALVHEWDTVYGRSLPPTFERIRREASQWYPRSLGTAATEPAGGDDPSGWENVHSYTYLRGVDGRAPGLDPASGSAAQGAGDGGAGRGPRPGGAELPIGRGQLDYVRRLVEVLQQDDAAWRAAGQGRLRAIGVFSSDSYDKLPVMQALREAFPDVLFFTNDLQAYLAHPSVYGSLRNTIVASHFDLRLGKQLQRTTPPFRSPYNTALFYAVRIATGAYNPAAWRKEGETSTGEGATPTGRVYEIARSGAYDLFVPPARKKKGADEESLSEDEKAQLAIEREEVIYPPSRRSVQWWPGGAWPFVAVLAGAALLAFGFHTWNYRVRPAGPGGRPLRGEAGWLVVSGTVAFVLLVVLPAWALHHFSRIGFGNADDEPFEFLEGISVWPGEVVRVFVCGLCVWCVATVLHELRVSSREIGEKFFGTPYAPRGRTGPEGGVWERARAAVRWIGDACIIGWKARRGGSRGAIDVVCVEQEYRSRGGLLARGVRVAVVLVGVYGVFVYALWRVLGMPDGPWRGGASRWWHGTLPVASFVCVNVLTFLVWDATRLCDRFIRVLASAPSDWGAAEGSKRGRAPMTEARAVWLDVQLIAERTDVVGRALYYPFIALLVVLLAWSQKIDHWPSSAVVVVSYVVSAAAALMAAQLLRRTAEQARQVEIGRLRERRVERLEEVGEVGGSGGPARAAAQVAEEASRIGPERPGAADGDRTLEVGVMRGAGDVMPPPAGAAPGAAALKSASPGGAVAQETGAAFDTERLALGHLNGDGAGDRRRRWARLSADQEIKQLEKTIEAVRSISAGAFGPLSSNPVVGAVLIPFGGFGAVQLIEAIPRWLQ